MTPSRPGGSGTLRAGVARAKLPVLAMLGLRARDIMGITFTVFLVLLPVVLVLVTVLGAMLPYPL